MEDDDINNDDEIDDNIHQFIRRWTIPRQTTSWWGTTSLCAKWCTTLWLLHFKLNYLLLFIYKQYFIRRWTQSFVVEKGWEFTSLTALLELFNLSYKHQFSTYFYKIHFDLLLSSILMCPHISSAICSNSNVSVGPDIAKPATTFPNRVTLAAKKFKLVKKR